MATELQYEYFQKLYEEENERYRDLAARGRFLLGLQTLYASALALKFKDFMEFAQGTRLPMQAIGAVGLLAGIGLLFTILAMRIRAYEGPSDLKDMITRSNFDSLRAIQAETRNGSNVRFPSNKISAGGQLGARLSSPSVRQPVSTHSG
jgi:hypothetical protein